MIIVLNVLSVVIFYTFLYFMFNLAFRRLINNKYDRELKIQTNGLRAWRGSKKNTYHRTESTPYLALESLLLDYDFKNKGNFVDIGSGKGRVAIFIHSKLNIKVKAIEANKLTYNEIYTNIKSYMNNDSKKSTLEVYNIYAEDYKVEKDDDYFFFFNPFNWIIFEKVIENILVNKNKNTEVILYYPTKKYIEVMKNKGFILKKKIKVKGSLSPLERIEIYSLIDTKSQTNYDKEMCSVKR